RPLSLRAVEEQAFLQWRTLVRRFSRSGDGPGPPANSLRVGGRLSCPPSRDAAVLRAPRPSRRSPGTVVFEDGARSSGARRRLALGGVRRPQVLFAALRWLHPHDLPAPEQAFDRSATRPMGIAAVPKRGRSAARSGSGIPGGVRRLSGVGNADRRGELPAGL